MRLIDADALKHKFASITYIRYTADMGQGGYDTFTEAEIEKIIDNALAVEQIDDTELQRAIGYAEGYAKGKNERPQGEWNYIGNTVINHSIKICECNWCKKRNYGETNFCPNCGKKMKRGGAEK